MIGRPPPVSYFVFRQDGSISGLWQFDVSTLKMHGIDLEFLLELTAGMKPVAFNESETPGGIPGGDASPDFARLRGADDKPLVPSEPELEAWLKKQAPSLWTLIDLAKAIYGMDDEEARVLLYRPKAQGGAQNSFGNRLRKAMGGAVDALRYEKWPVIEGEGLTGRTTWRVSKPVPA